MKEEAATRARLESPFFYIGKKKKKLTNEISLFFLRLETAFQKNSFQSSDSLPS